MYSSNPSFSEFATDFRFILSRKRKWSEICAGKIDNNKAEIEVTSYSNYKISTLLLAVLTSKNDQVFV